MNTFSRLPILFWLMAMPWQNAAALENELVFCYENENVRPWRTKAGSGLNFDLLDRVAGELKLKFRYEGMPWKRCLFELKGNVYAGAIGASFKPERLEFGSYPGGRQADVARMLYMERYVVVRRKHSPVTWNGKTFEQLRNPIGAPLGYSVVDDLRHNGHHVDDGTYTAGGVLQKLILGRIDAGVLLRGEISTLMAEDEKLRSKLEILPRPYIEKPYYLMFSHQQLESRPELAERIWSGLARERTKPAYLDKERRALSPVR